MAGRYLGKDIEHVFEVQCLDTASGVTQPVWYPAFRFDVDGEVKLLHMAQSTWGTDVWMTEPKLVRVDDIAHLLTPAQQADMKRP